MELDFYSTLQIIFFVIILIAIAFPYIKDRKKIKKQHLLSSIIWLLIIIILVIFYIFRFELEASKARILSSFMPSANWEDESGRIVIARSTDGHFYLNAYSKSNNKITFLVDTGASDIALTKKDAIKLGIKIDKLQYTKKYHTANGIVFSAPVIIKQMRIGKKIFHNLKGHVSSGGLGISLLGMSIIDDFSNFSISKDMLILEHDAN